jgi:hypothetical protein
VSSSVSCVHTRSQIAATHALLMLLGSDNYLRQKMSSTVVSSLMTGVPVIADAAVLHAYTFLAPGTAFVMGPGESELDVMLRVCAAASFAVLRSSVRCGCCGAARHASVA